MYLCSMIQRAFITKIRSQLSENKKIVVLYGARQIGKTTMLRELARDYDAKVLWVNGDLAEYQEVLSSRSKQRLTDFIDDNQLLIIDEAQNIPHIRETLKILYDEFSHVRVIATGSSALQLAGKTKESLAGRAVTMYMQPIAMMELRATHSKFEIRKNLSNYLLYGCYPEVLTTTGAESKKALLTELVSSYLYRDVLQLSNIKNSDKIYKLLQLLAYQIGDLVSVHELAKTLSLNHETVSHYIDLLQKSFVIFSLSGLSNNPRKEISKMDKYYFVDVGIRNSLINDFNEPDIRADKGGLWENFFIAERIKYLIYNDIPSINYFWRRYSGAEIDWVEQRDGVYHCLEIKWKKLRKSPPKSWVEGYPSHTYQSVNTENFLDFVL